MSRGKIASWTYRALRWWYAVRYYRASQMAMRLVSVGRRWSMSMTGGVAQRRLRRYALPQMSSLGEGTAPTVPQRRHNPALETLLDRKLAERCASGASENAARILQQRFRLLNRERVLADPVDWRLTASPGAARLWRFHLHYQEYLLDLAAEGVKSGDGMWFGRAWQLVADWIEHNWPDDPRTLADAWHPYCISRRLPVWILLWLARPPDSELSPRVLGSIFAQSRFLERHLEWDVRGNHLLENVRALLLVGAFLDGPDADRWLATGARILRRELAEQILPHGEHFERSPMYHAQMLEAVLDVRDAVGHIIPELGALCLETAAAMARFLEAILHPDGKLPLLGDTCLGGTPLPSRLIGRAECGVRRPAQSAGVGRPAHSACGMAQASGLADMRHRQDACATVDDSAPAPAGSPMARVIGDYWVYRHAGDFLIFDAGPVGPDHLPAHAHADLLSFQASLEGRRLFVDSGVFGYEDDAMRRYCRSSAAHNVLRIDARDQCDMWSRFRMGYRGWPQGLEWGESNGFYWARATHNAYRRLGVPRVGRWLACRPGGPWLCVDWAEGKGRHQLSSRLHLHPSVSACLVGPDEVRLTVAGAAIRLRPLTPGQLEITTGWYCPQFGHRLKCPTVQWTSAQAMPTVCGWYLVWDYADGVATVARADSGHLVLLWTGRHGRLQLHPTSAPGLSRP